jgi:hypothetical protein
MIQIEEVTERKSLQAFVDFPFRLYQNAPYWIPPLKKSELANLRPDINPAFEHSDVKIWVAKENGQIKGRIVGLINHLETEYRGEKHARFGWLEFEDDPRVTEALFQTFESWARRQEAVLMKGPMGFSNMDPVAMTVEGFDELGTPSGAFHHPYYLSHMERLGFEKMLDWLEHKVETIPEEPPAKLKRLFPLVQKKYGVQQHFFKTKKELQSRLREFFRVVGKSYQSLPIYVPLSEKQIDRYIDYYLNFIDLDYTSIITDKDDQMIGFGITIPSFSEALQKANGSLFPFGFWHILKTKRKHKTVDLILIGVVEEWRGKGLNAIIFGNTIEALNRNKVSKVRINPILEENMASLMLFKDYTPRPFRRRRVFKKQLS